MLELLNTRVTLVKSNGKGGWTYAPVGLLPEAPKTHFGVLKVCGRIDAVLVENCTLFPMGQGRRLLAVNAALRKKLGKQAGDEVQLQLFLAPDNVDLGISLADFTDCLAESPAALRAFRALPTAARQQWLRWVGDAASEPQQVARVEAALARLGRVGASGKDLLPPQ